MNACIRRIALSVALSGFALFNPAVVHATPCAGFSDVDSSASYCSAVDWVKSRGITLGCTTGQYCPDAVVTRASMALFLTRLASATLPQFLANSQPSPAVAIPPNGNATLNCSVAVDAAPYARKARIAGTVSADSGNDIRMVFGFQENGSSDLQLLGANGMPLPRTAGFAVSHIAGPGLTLSANTSYVLFIVLKNIEPFAASVSAGLCDMDVILVSAAP